MMKQKDVKNNLLTPAEERAERKGVPRKGDSFFRTRNTDLAVCLLTCGVQPHYANAIHKVLTKDGTNHLMFHLAVSSPDGEIHCNKAVGWWKQGVDFISENPEHPFAIAMATLMNKKSFLDYINQKKRTIIYNLEDGPTVYVTEGTKRQLALKQKYGY